MVILRITVEGKTLDMPATFTLKEKMAVRLATGLPFEAFVGTNSKQVGEDSLAVLWWLARRRNGEPALAWEQAEAQWPANVNVDQLALEVIDDEDGVDETPES